MNENGLRQGYYLGVFAKFLWHFAVMFIVQTIIFYIFGYNVFTYYVMAIFLSFLINSSLPMGENYPFIRHGFILAAILIVQSYSYKYVLGKMYSFFEPTSLWSTFMIVSIFFGIINSFGRYGNGTYSRHIENFSVLALFVMLVTTFIIFWWQGGLAYLILRIPMMIAETSIANALLYYLMNKHNSENTYES
ncbi:hypothetical protein BG53_13095 [Paenibacillus darwinianus]|uniref:Uncharacterized protein n=1 Tax=Paenibacillus darwinianus TaxID=1380763 RepID=A0A9W5S2F6_9BACL|nr:hypothetical protein [Paenibacillus darwinianus]EXX89513.1 hypothetical protein CH50_01225 [Paenibacillus darwinianus]EXX90723.1 hypothetical protein BG53_13095 [Paenibacillus darwinianus]EXX90929.1 hypothetical protein BG52_11840 [Paenibacillus darwinianus]